MKLLATMTCLFALAACDKPATTETKPEDPNAKNAPAVSATAATTAATPAPVTIADTDIATPADFEATAEQAITAKNYKAELATLEADVAKE